MDIIFTKSITNKLVVGFVVFGVLALLVRAFLSSSESVPAGDSVWELTMSVEVASKDEFPTIYMAVPLGSANNRIISQTFTHPGFDLKRITQRKNATGREIVAVAREKGNLTLTGEYKIHVSETKRWQKWLKGTDELKAEERMRFLELPEEQLQNNSHLNAVLNSLSAKTQDQEVLVEEIFKYAHRKILGDNTIEFESVEKTLSQKRADALGKASVMIALCRASNIPARLVTGIIVKEMLGVREHHWVEVYSDGHWIPYDPMAGYSADIPANYLKLKENSAQLAYQKEGQPLDVVIDVTQLPVPTGLLGTGKKRFMDIFDLARLPVSTQFLLSSLLLLPLGALVTIFFRNMVGVQTYGTFTASLLALSMIYADWITVTVVVGLVTVVGIGGRSLLPKKISRAPRLSVVLTIVAISMVFSVSFMDYYDLNPSPSVVLLPIIVLTGLIDRVYAIADERGVAVAIYRLVWTCLVAGVCFMVFSIEVLRLTLVNYPELHFFTLSLMLLFSAYKWKMLTETEMFKWIREPKALHSKEAVSSEEKKNVHKTDADIKT